MARINSNNVRKLREQQNLTLDDLAEKSRVNRSTISRIENGKHLGSRGLTLRNLAAALSVEEAMLTGPDIDEADHRPILVKKTQMNIKMAVDARNALNLVAIRYNVKPGEILHLAPFLFYWAAEESLKRRSAKLDEILEKYEALSAVNEPRHLSGLITNNWRGEDVIDEERRSIASRDIFGSNISGDSLNPGYEESEHNPMATFLKSVANSLGDDVEFEYWSKWWGNPEYTLGKEEALKIVGGDDEAANHIINGNAPLHELPKEIRDQGASAIARWAKDIGGKLLSELMDFDVANFGLGGTHND